MGPRHTLFFTAKHQVEVRQDIIPAPAPGQLLIKTIVSAISSGTEMLVYRAEFPNISVDTNFNSMSSSFKYPLAYGYSCVGRVIELGQGVDAQWLGRLVFSFQPHASHFCAVPDELWPLPPGVEPDNACFLPNMETAVNLVQDAAPILGERVLVIGLGVVGLLTSALLSEFPLDRLVCSDKYLLRRSAAEMIGRIEVADPSSTDFFHQSAQMLYPGADLVIELSGSPAALDTAISLTMFSGRIVIGSWYGEKQASLHLGGSFHRSRIKMISSQVSTISPDLSARWDKSRRFDVAWKALNRLRPEKWITHRFPLSAASTAYEMLDQKPENAIQVVFDYE